MTSPLQQVGSTWDPPIVKGEGEVIYGMYQILAPQRGRETLPSYCVVDPKRPS